MHTLTALFVLGGVVYVIATAVRAAKEEEFAVFGCGCCIVPFLVFAVAPQLWNDLHPGVPMVKNGVVNPQYDALIGRLMQLGALLLSAIVNYRLNAEQRSYAALVSGEPKATAPGHTLDRLLDHPLVSLLALISSILTIVGFYLQFLRR